MRVELRGISNKPGGELTRQDFVSSVLTLSTVRQGTSHLRKRIGELDGQMGDVGRALGEKVMSSSVSTIDDRRNGLSLSRRRSQGVWTTQLKRCRPACVSLILCIG